MKLMLKRCFHVALLEREYRELQQKLQGDAFEGMLGTHSRMQAVFDSIRKVATTDAPVLILGESGTGKEMAAQAIHQRSSRNSGPFIPINCSAIPETLIESELFGHEKGAFTGHTSSARPHRERQRGHAFPRRDRGDTLPLQVKLLRFLQEQRIERVGGRQEIQVDTRVIAATNVDLKKAMAEGTSGRTCFTGWRSSRSCSPACGPRGRHPSPGPELPEPLCRAEQEAGVVIRPGRAQGDPNYAWPGTSGSSRTGEARRHYGCAKRLTAQDLEISASASAAHGSSLKDAREALEREMIVNALRKHRARYRPRLRTLGSAGPRSTS